MKSAIAATVALVVLTIVSCHSDPEFRDPNSEVSYYDKSWASRYGVIDATNTWNLATAVNATINTGTTSDIVHVRIYTAEPSNADCRLLARFNVTGTTTASFDVPQTLQQIYATGWTSSGKIIDGTFTIANGQTDIQTLTASVAGTEETEPAPMEWIIACEDLSASDNYTFNDAVFSISHVAGETTATLTPLAAGGRYATKIIVNNNSLGEIHQLIDPSATPMDNLYKPLNTTSRGKAGEPITFNVDKNFSLAYNNVTNRNMGNVAIQVKKVQENQTLKTITILAPQRGNAPQMILVPYNWAWPKADIQIENAYPDFINWNQHAATYATWAEKVGDPSLVVH